MSKKSDYKYYNFLLALVPKSLGNLDIITNGDTQFSDCIRVVYHYLFMLKLSIWKRDPSERPQYYKEGWVPVSFRLIEQIIYKNKANEVLRFMVDNGLLEEKMPEGHKSYIVGERSTLFRIPGKLYQKKQRGFLYRKEKVTTKHLIKKVLKHKELQKEKNITDQFKLSHVDYIALVTMVEQFQPLTLSTQQLMLNNKGSGVEDYDALKMLFETFSSDHANCKSCEFGDRFHTPFTSLKSSFRGLFRFKDHINEPHVSLDLANSQFYFLAVLMSKPILIKRYLPEFKIVLPLLKGSSEENDVHDFMKLTSAGILYEYWAEKRWPIESLTCQLTTRDRAKSELSYVLFGKVYTHPSTPNYNELKDAKELFQKLFPTVWRIIVGIKELGKEELPFMDQFYYDKRTGKYKGNKLSHKNISALLQRLESRILIGTISSRLIKKKVVFVTIHDSFLAPSKFEKLIKNEIELFFKWYKLPPPKLKLETL